MGSKRRVEGPRVSFFYPFRETGQPRKIMAETMFASGTRVSAVHSKNLPIGDPVTSVKYRSKIVHPGAQKCIIALMFS